MQAPLNLDDDANGVPVPIPKHLGHQWARGRRTHARSAALPPEVEAAIWRGSELGSAVQNTLPSGMLMAG